MSLSSFAQQANALRSDVAHWVEETLKPFYRSVGDLRLERTRILPKSSRVEIYLNSTASYLLYRDDIVQWLYAQADSVVHRVYPKYDVVIFSDKKRIEFFVPNYCRTSSQYDKRRFVPHKRALQPVVKNLSQPYEITQGLTGRNLALWSSHGMYYNQQQDRWRWQRARLFSTVEDKLTLNYVLNFLLPMLENAGANVFLPHERDMQRHEVIVDNDTSWRASMFEDLSNGMWKKGGNSAYAPLATIEDLKTNPFKAGTYLWTNASREATASLRWIPDVPESGFYAVYVAYQSKENSVTDAHYSVHHTGGTTDFVVNQQQGGGTWIYLGDFHFAKGVNVAIGSVELTNVSVSGKGVVTADAVRLGGGVGNVARKPASADKVAQYNIDFKKKLEVSPYVTKEQTVTSGVPRYLEAARYWLQTAGFGPEVFSRTQGVDDYYDDIAARGLWVNALNYGSENAPDSVGLAVPIDLALGFHTDAGVKTNDTIVGSLGIFTAKEEEELFPNNQSRYASREFADMVLTELETTLSQQFNVDWNVRGLWNKSYLESRLPNVPTMLLELLSHQNPTDVRFALDPHFQFAAARAVYKAVVKFLAWSNGEKYTIQPLPVNSFYVEQQGDSLRLGWRPTIDSLTVGGAAPTGYVIYTQEEDCGFDNGTFTTDTTFLLALKKDVLYRFKVTAVNAGGESFASQTLSACFASKSSETLLVVNGFDRLAAPDFFETDEFFGIGRVDDCGVPYKTSCFYTGSQYDFVKTNPWISDDAPGFGASSSTYDTQIVAGNTFDYVATHVKAIRQAGYSFVSCSRQAVEDSLVNLNRYKTVDLLLGKQRSTLVGLDSLQWHYKVISPKMQCRIADFCTSGGALMISGAYLASDMCNESDIAFLQNCLKVKHNTTIVASNGTVVPSYSTLEMPTDSIRYCQKPSPVQYHVGQVDAFLPTQGAFEVLRYTDNGTTAATAYAGANRLWVMGFPFEAITDEQQRNKLMFDILNFLTTKTTIK